MLLFCKPSTTSAENVIIPLGRVFEIVTNSCRVIIRYNGGEFLETEQGTFPNRVSELVIMYDSPDEVNKAIRQFYKAINSNSSVFLFGQRQEIQPYNNNR